VLALTVARAAAVVVAALLVWRVRPWLGRLVIRRTLRELAGAAAPTLLAIVLALGASELLLRHLPWRATHQAPGQREPLRRWEARLGWVYVPSRTGRGDLGGRTLEYAFDAAGHRVPNLARPVDYSQPAILFAGESIVAGHGLTWAESLPARVEALTRVLGSGASSQCTIAPGRKFVPATERVNAGPPATADEGDKPAMVGTGAVMVSVAGAEAAPAFCTVTTAVPGAAISSARTGAISWVGLMAVVVRAELLNRIALPAPNPVPLTRRVKVVPPATTDPGSRELMTGLGLRIVTSIGTLDTPDCDTATFTFPGFTIRAAGTSAFRVDELTKVVVRAIPFH